MMGPQGSGKGTQAALLAKALGSTHLATGDLLRQLGDAGISGRLADGHLIDDATTTTVLKKALEQLPPNTDVVLDGYPRNLKQVELLDKLLDEHGLTLTKVILLDISPEESKKRLLERSRADDNHQAIGNRLNQFDSQTTPAVQEYAKRGLLTKVDGTGSVEAVTARIQKALGDAA